MLGAKMRIAVRTDQAFVPENLGDFLQCPSIPRQGGGRIVAQVMPAVLLDVGLLQASGPLLPVVERLVRISA